MPIDYSSPYSGMDVDYSQGEPSYAMKQNRGFAANWGKNMDTQIGGNQSEQDRLRAYYQQQQDRLYGDLEQTPGWTTDEAGNIIRDDAYQSGRTSDDQFRSLDPTSDEARGIRGDTSGYGKYFDPSAMAGNVGHGSIMGDAYINDAYGDMSKAIGTERDMFGRAIQDPNLRPSSDWYNALDDRYTGTVSGVRGAIDPRELSLDLDRNKYEMSDDEVQQIQNQAANTVLSSRTNALQDIRRNALASGNADPAAYAALRTQYQGQADKEAADARTDAYLKAKGAQRDLSMNYAQAKLGANQGYAGLRSSAEMDLGKFGVDEADLAQKYTQDAARYIADASRADAGKVGEQEIGAAGYRGTGGQKNALDYTNAYNDTLKYAGTEGADIEMAKDKAATDREAELYGARADNAKYGQQQKFGQNLTTNEQLSSLYGKQADTRIAGQNNLRNWATGQGSQALQGSIGYGGQRLQAGATTIGGVNTSTGQWGDYDLAKSGRGFGANFMASLGKTLGSPSFSYAG